MNTPGFLELKSLLQVCLLLPFAVAADMGSTAQQLVFDSSANSYELSITHSHITRRDPQGRILWQVGSAGKYYDQYSAISGLTQDDGWLAVVDTGRASVTIYDLDGNLLTTLGGKGQAYGQLSQPHPDILLSSSELLVADPGNARVQFYSLERAEDYRHILTDGPAMNPQGLAEYETGRYLTVDRATSRLLLFDRKSGVLERYHLPVDNDVLQLEVQRGRLFMLASDHEVYEVSMEERQASLRKIKTDLPVVSLASNGDVLYSIVKHGRTTRLLPLVEAHE